MRILTKSLSGAQRACLPIGKSVLGTLLILAGIAVLPMVSHAQNTPIKHVIVVFGENRSFDHVFGTFVPRLVLKQHADQVTGTFEEYGRTYSLTGSLQGQAITFDVPFTGPTPYTIEFKGTIDHEKMTGTSGLKGGGQVFLGHAGEVDEPQRPWIAVKGLKRPLDASGKPPKDDDD